jgi:hypothetical protein
VEGLLVFKDACAAHHPSGVASFVGPLASRPPKQAPA